MTLENRVHPHRLTAVFIAGITLAFAPAVLAQPEDTEPSADPDVGPAPVEPAPVEEPVPVEEPAPLEEPEAAAPAEPTDPVEEEAAPEESGLSTLMFVDSYYSYNKQNPRFAHPGHRAYDGDNGFVLAWVGLDATYEAGPIAATASMRVGRGAEMFFGEDQYPYLPLSQAYLSWSPVEQLTLDVGMFGTIYGAEVAESWQNLNYTRGALYYMMQPFWHTGIRGNVAFSDMVELNFLLVNGTNQAFALNHAPALGAQIAMSPTDEFSFAVGYLHQTDPDSSVGFPGPRPGATTIDEATGEEVPAFGPNPPGIDQFFDVVATAELGDATIIANFDFGMCKAFGCDQSFWGISLAAGYAFTEVFGAAIRGEYLGDPDGWAWGIDANGDPINDSLVTGTLTLEAKPHENLIIRWDNRFESSASGIYTNRNGDAASSWYNTILGLVVKTE